MQLTFNDARSHQPLAVFLLLQPGEYRVLLGSVDFALTCVRGYVWLDAGQLAMTL